jgi:hypothetical protein
MANGLEEILSLPWERGVSRSRILTGLSAIFQTITSRRQSHSKELVSPKHLKSQRQDFCDLNSNGLNFGGEYIDPIVSHRDEHPWTEIENFVFCRAHTSPQPQHY